MAHASTCRVTTPKHIFLDLVFILLQVRKHLTFAAVKNDLPLQQPLKYGPSRVGHDVLNGGEVLSRH